MVLHVDGGADVHARLFADCGRYELEAGDLHHPPGKSDRAHPDASECARRGEVWNSVCGVCARQLRYARSESSCDAAGLGRLRVVRNSVVAWWAGDCGNDCRLMAGDSSHAICSVGEFSWILAFEYVCGVARCRIDSVSAELFGTVHACYVVHPAVLDAAQGGWLWADAFGAEPFPYDGQLSSLLLSVADGDGGLLGDAVSEHPGLYALCEISGFADRRSGVWPASRDGVVFVDRDCLHFGVGDDLWRAGVVAHHAAWAGSSAAGGFAGAGCTIDCDAQCKHRGKRRFSFERLLEPRSRFDQFPHWWPDYGLAGACDDAMEVDEHFWELYLWVAHWLLWTARPGCGHHGRRLFSDSRDTPGYGLSVSSWRSLRVHARGKSPGDCCARGRGGCRADRTRRACSAVFL